MFTTYFSLYAAPTQSFKAANPGCTLADFVRWHSPKDWVEDGGPNGVSVHFHGGAVRMIVPMDMLARFAPALCCMLLSIRPGRLHD